MRHSFSMHPFKALIFIAAFLAVHVVEGTGLAAEGAPRETLRIDDHWKFFLGEAPEGALESMDDSAWRTVTLPHDWSIEGKFDARAPMGGQGGFLPAGIGWYRYHWKAPSAWTGKKVRVEFEGVYMNSEVYLNGLKLNFQPYGYTTFFVDLTSGLKLGADNLLAVRVDNAQQKNSRWYSGSGLYRHVWLHVTSPVQVAPWGVYVITPSADPAQATVQVQTTILNQESTPQSAQVETQLLSPQGKELGEKYFLSLQVPAHSSGTSDQSLELKNPPLWSPDQPQLCRVQTRVLLEGKVVDQLSTPFGIRTLAWSVENGFTINAKTIKLSGGCIHHDNGVLGACAFDRAEERKIELLKAAGFNAIRTAHNPPSPSLLDACDRIGMLVMDEAFDCWANGKNHNDYSVVFKEWWEKDLTAQILRDRNHPSVALWSIGNEIPGIYDAMGGEYGPKMAQRIHSLDKTRPVTNGILGWPVDEKNPKPTDADRLKNAEANWNSLDIVGTNYALGHHLQVHQNFPQRILVSTESSPPIGKAYEVADNSFAIGDFVWSAQDYLGEVGIGRSFYEGDPSEPVSPPKDPTDTKVHPVMHGNDHLYPWHGANSGDLDLLGQTKPAGHLRNILWNQGEKIYLAVREPVPTGKKVVTVGWGWFPTWASWTWPGQEGKNITVEVYSRYEKIRLYLNDGLIGEKPTTRGQNFTASFEIPYQPGILKAVGMEAGQELNPITLETATAPVALRLSADRLTIRADGQDLSYITVEAVDEKGRLQPNAEALVDFKLQGPGSLAGLGNAWLKNEEPYQGTACHLYHGVAQVVLRSDSTPGKLQLSAQAKALKQGAIEVQSQ